MKRIFMSTLAVMAVVASYAASAAAKEKITYVHVIDPSHSAIMWAINNGKVTSDKIDIEITAVPIPALIQATSTKQYDVVETAVPSIALAQARGLKLVVLSVALRLHEAGEAADIWVRADSPIKTVQDLKGKELAVYGIRSTGITLTRIVLWKKYGFNVALAGGDLKFSELPAPTIPGALAAGKVDAAALIHFQAYQANKSDKLRSIQAGQKDMVEVLGVRPVTAINISYPEKLAARPEAFKEFNRMLKASADYVLAHKAEVFRAVEKKMKVAPGFFEAWFSRYSEFPASVSRDDIKAMNKLWQFSKELGALKDYPDAESVVWEHAIRE